MRKKRRTDDEIYFDRQDELRAGYFELLKANCPRLAYTFGSMITYWPEDTDFEAQEEWLIENDLPLNRSDWDDEQVAFYKLRWL